MSDNVTIEYDWEAYKHCASPALDLLKNCQVRIRRRPPHNAIEGIVVSHDRDGIVVHAPGAKMFVTTVDWSEIDTMYVY